jgi:glycine/D-amino acid oxidase-like deaminating enzyme
MGASGAGPVKDRYDIAIIGAGPAGVAAAAAAGPHASVLLIEAGDRLGGSVTAAMHRCMCGLYAAMPASPIDTLNPSVQRELVLRMFSRQPEKVVARMFGVSPVLEFPQRLFASALGEICAESQAELRLNCRLTNVRRDGDRIVGIELSDGSARWLSVGALVDCTGGGHALKLAGPDAYQPVEDERRMLGGYAVRLEKVSGDAEMMRLEIPFALHKAVDGGILPEAAKFTVFYPGPGVGEGICKFAVDPTKYTGEAARGLADRAVEYLRGEVTALRDAVVAESSPRVLPRDGLRLRGKFTIGEEDILHARRHGVDAVHAWWPMERWDISSGPSYIYPPVGQPYDIPPGALQSEAIENLLAAGTCISATAAAAASTRASGICLATGYAAGRLALSRVAK